MGFNRVLNSFYIRFTLLNLQDLVFPRLIKSKSKAGYFIQRNKIDLLFGVFDSAIAYINLLNERKTLLELDRIYFLDHFVHLPIYRVQSHEIPQLFFINGRLKNF